MNNEPKKEYVIWNFERDMWWKPDHNGYTPFLFEAGLYTLEEGSRIVADANKFMEEGKPNEELISFRQAERDEKEYDLRQESDDYDRRTAHLS